MTNALLFLALSAQLAASTPSLQVVGTSSVELEPDCVEVSFAVEAFAREQDEAVKRFEAVWSRTQATIKDLKLPGAKLRTEGLVFGERTKVEPGFFGENRQKGVQVRRTMTVKLTDPERLSDLVSALARAGVEEVSRVNFTSSKLEEQVQKARELAARDAKRQAEAITRGLEQPLGQAMSVVEERAAQVTFQSYSNVSTKSQRRLQTPGSVSTTVRLRVVFELPKEEKAAVISRAEGPS